MYEVTRWGWVRTPEELERLTMNKKYRLKMNWVFFIENSKNIWLNKSYLVESYNIFVFWDRFKWELGVFKYYFFNLILNRNNF